ncbi:MAG: putative toxin-antitoxin system toxin component, PIN family [Clostridium sp.]|nr:putative toxin-antitoxin system toxin component, PIN family [Clostridium sp.]MCM1172851.1 putative toxin-antitoxin system toxin component, PIN family [Clostridium sp.]MCM1208420.1 putative toxin-antitoxin system toxin component, PIN family [Ruminococcus sp.]
MVFYAVIDTNVLVSALLSSHADAATVLIVGKLFSGEVIPLFSDEILKEYHDVLRRTKFHFSEDTVHMLLQTIEKYGEHVVPMPTGELLSDMKDLPFYEVVVEKQKDAAYLITGNIKHFPTKPFIVTAKEFWDILNAAK